MNCRTIAGAAVMALGVAGIRHAARNEVEFQRQHEQRWDEMKARGRHREAQAGRKLHKLKSGKARL